MTATTQAQDGDRLTGDGRYYEYSKAANPIASGLIPRVPLADFPHHLHESGPTRIIPFDLSKELKCPGPATSPALCANFIRICPGERIATAPNATSELYYVIRGRGRTRVEGHAEEIPWSQGDFFTLPAASPGEHSAETDAAFYWIHDEPLLRYLGVRATTPRFRPTLYPADRAVRELDRVEHDPDAAKKSRVSVLLANKEFPQTRTITHVIWAMFGVLPAGAVQLAHHHESVALDFIIDCRPGCYTLIGDKLDDGGNIANGRRADWKPGSAFVTPPGLWHSHHNESGGPAHLMPIQDAGLHTYLRTLDIHFVHKDPKVYISQKG
jgi:gentisate 1,2-dioxygenase